MPSLNLRLPGFGWLVVAAACIGLIVGLVVSGQDHRSAPSASGSAHASAPALRQSGEVTTTEPGP